MAFVSTGWWIAVTGVRDANGSIQRRRSARGCGTILRQSRSKMRRTVSLRLSRRRKMKVDARELLIRMGRMALHLRHHHQYLRSANLCGRSVIGTIPQGCIDQKRDHCGDTHHQCRHCRLRDDMQDLEAVSFGRESHTDVIGHLPSHHLRHRWHETVELSTMRSKALV